jgi:hypothetical protein
MVIDVYPAFVALAAIIALGLGVLIAFEIWRVILSRLKIDIKWIAFVSIFMKEWQDFNAAWRWQAYVFDKENHMDTLRRAVKK